MKHRSKLATAVASLTAVALLAGSPAQGYAGEYVPNINPAVVSGNTIYWDLDQQIVTTQQWTATGSVTPLQGDFNNDGRQDMFMYGPGSTPDALWLSTSAQGTDANRFTVVNFDVNGNQYKPFAGDFDGNGSDDIFWYAPGDQPDSIWYMSYGSLQESVPFTVNGTYQPSVANFDTNESLVTDDIFWYGQNATESLWSGQTNKTFVTKAFSSSVGPGAKVIQGNWKADASPLQGQYNVDIFFYVPGAGADYIWSGKGDGTFNVQAKPVNGNYTPITGNFDTGMPGVLGGLTDIIWYTAGTAADSIWMNGGNGNFTSKAVTINGTYKPFVIPGVVGSDTIVWNNPGGGDSVWSPTGTTTNFLYSTRPWQGSDMGTRVPYVGMYNDRMIDLLGPLDGSTGPLSSTFQATTTTQISPTSAYKTEWYELSTYDVLWIAPGTGTGLTEVMWTSDGMYAPVRTPVPVLPSIP